MRWATVLGIVLVGLSSARAADPEPVPVGVAQIDITPTTPIRLAGYGSRKTESEGVAGRLRAKALAIGADGDPGPVLLLTVENCGVPAAMTDEVARRLEGKVARARLAVCSSHTHTGPCLSNVLPYIFGAPIPADQMERITAYSRELVDKLTSAALAALADRKPGRLAWGRGRARFAANRRVLKDGKWTGFGVNPDGPVDHTLPLLRVTGEDGSLRAVFLSYACHCTTLDGNFNQVHGDWIGSAQEAIERDHPGALALLAVGCGGDANPEPRTKLEHVRQHGEAIAAEVTRLLEAGDLKPLPGEVRAGRATIKLPFAELPSRDELARRAERPGAEGLHAKDMLARLGRGESPPRDLDYVLQAWRFGDDLAIVFLAGEVVVDYAIRLNRELNASRLWVIAYANDVPCYIASKRILEEGGYEADLSMIYYGHPTRLAPEAEDRIVEAVRGLLPEGSFGRSGRSR
jgi:hypothetical protein